MNFPTYAANVLLRLMGWKTQQDIPEIPAKCVVIGAPHVSWKDAVVGVGGAVTLRLKVKFLVKKEFMVFPLNLILGPMGGVPVNRDKIKGAESRKKLLAEISQQFETNDSFILIISPEGTRKKVTRWKRGFYRIAVAANVPIVLCYMDHVNKIGGVGKVIHPTGDMEKDMRAIMAFYNSIPQKYPDRFSTDLEFS